MSTDWRSNLRNRVGGPDPLQDSDRIGYTPVKTLFHSENKVGTTLSFPYTPKRRALLSCLRLKCVMKFLSKPVDMLDVVSWTVFCNMCKVDHWQTYKHCMGLGERSWKACGSFVACASEFLQGIPGSRREGYASWSHSGCEFEQRINAAVGVRTAGNTKGVHLSTI